MRILVALFDLKAEAFLQVSQAATVAVAVRDLQDAVNEGGESTEHLRRYADDFALFQVGVFDEVEGVITPDRRKLVEVSALVRAPSSVVPVPVGTVRD